MKSGNVAICMNNPAQNNHYDKANFRVVILYALFCYMWSLQAAAQQKITYTYTEEYDSTTQWRPISSEYPYTKYIEEYQNEKIMKNSCATK